MASDDTNQLQIANKHCSLEALCPLTEAMFETTPVVYLWL
jgi:hypothetical protein